jgi:hypothetical protein
MSAPVLEGSSLQRLRDLLLAEGGLMASLVAGAGPDGAPSSDGYAASDRVAPHADGSAPPAASCACPDGPAQLVASGPRAAGRPAEYELLIETIYEGYLLHYGAPRVVCPPESDLALLAGDRLYALGLARLVELGDVEAVAELADTITLSALAHGAGRPELAEMVWITGARAVGWGASVEYERAKALVRAASPAAVTAMRKLAAG